MSDPTEVTHANPHPVSGHRTPREIAKDEAGRIGQPDEDVIAKHSAGETPPRQSAGGRTPHAPTSKRSGKRG